MAHLWSGRFDSQPDPRAFDFQASFRFDRVLFEDDVTGSLAWAEALEAAGVLSPDEARQIIAALRDMLEQATRDPAFVDGPDEDVHSFVERQLVSRLGEVGKRLHTGRSRNEQVALDLRLYLRRRIRTLQWELTTVIRALLDQADRADRALMPSYTHLRRAQPVLVAHYLLAHAAALRRDFERLEGVRGEADALPLGSGAIAGASYHIDTAALAARLGLSRVVPNSVDAVADRDFVSAFLHACALAMVHLSRLAEDLVLFTSEEFGFFELSDTVATGSSLMPQKKNPDALELARGKAGRTIGHVAGWLSTMKGLPSGYNKDLQEDKEAVFDAEATLAGTLGALEPVVRTLKLNRERTEQAAGGFLLATDVAEYLVSRGLPFRSAHELVGRMVQRLAADGRDFASLSLADWQAYSPLFGEDVTNYVTARASVERRTTPQSTRPDAVAQALADVRAWLALRGREPLC